LRRPKLSAKGSSATGRSKDKLLTQANSIYGNILLREQCIKKKNLFS
jgi:hypothetical protein